MGIGQAANTRVGNLLGAGDGRQASLVLRLSLVFALVVQCLLSGVIYSLRERVAYICEMVILSRFACCPSR